MTPNVRRAHECDQLGAMNGSIRGNSCATQRVALRSTKRLARPAVELISQHRVCLASLFNFFLRCVMPHSLAGHRARSPFRRAARAVVHCAGRSLMIVMLVMFGVGMGAEAFGDVPWRRPGDPVPPLVLPDASERFLVLCYHDVPKVIEHNDRYAVDRRTFIETIEYLRAHDYHFIGIDDVMAAREGRRPLPERSVLLTFDDGYASFYDFVFPLLRQYGYPSVLAVVSGWIDQKPSNVKQELMTWEQLREVAQSGLVEIASHTHDLHHGIPDNPQGNEGAALVSRRYDPATGQYESDAEFQARLLEDLRLVKQTLEQQLGVPLRAIAWPYGRYNVFMAEEAQQAGFSVLFRLANQLASVRELPAINRVILDKNPAVSMIAKDLKRHFQIPEHQRIVHTDLDLIYDSDPAQTEKNLGQFMDRIVAMKPSAVYLQAFADPEGDSRIREVYFPNRVLPMRADLFSRVAHQLAAREIQVYAWLPMLNIVLPDAAEQAALRVREFHAGGSAPTEAWYPERLSPFSAPARAKLATLYEDLARYAEIDGVLFLDDGYLSDREDFHPDALPIYAAIAGGADRDPEQLTEEQRHRWTSVKTQALIDVTDALREAVVRHRPYALFGPYARFARTLYAPVVTDPEQEEEFAQNYARSLDAYDFVVIMAYPRQEEVARPERWLERLVRIAAAHPQGLEKTVFKIQAYDWERDEWIEAETLNRWLQRLVAAGARHVAYYPDDYTQEQPHAETIRLMMSIEDFPVKRDGFVQP